MKVLLTIEFKKLKRVFGKYYCHKNNRCNIKVRHNMSRKYISYTLYHEFTHFMLDLFGKKQNEDMAHEIAEKANSIFIRKKLGVLHEKN